ncbi:MAG TPA: DNA-directed RNA polymerase subunit omega [Candidatus Hydrogenedentes bacterium]|jgi:DNA-directed RNA polymerase omega subunit|nr:MAG: DNA-directed RNA polymerase subunit omega [Candidatus Hydrogenedentes bacterium ADurb.Bin170]HNZ48768.1 DNA-directed RNA polymerase subunit omega [Candidatus Hydrogenedentota bacterium]HOD95693.1 DNA-directed RNA polymerase subunit omega [Candidatus Hydrogenedentota bacterium]HOH43047.1 DNA-directed RNA polymerase subunit omega [Candidatus Hydrogenedentota bacterium]HOM49293.1 DNA-directed RNA polymerase subunit omega [Candidatus Hydrogenedentota bacterium]
MPTPYCVDDFSQSFDSLYRLVIVAAARSNQLASAGTHGFGSLAKPTVRALEEVIEGKLQWADTDELDEPPFDEEEE